MTMQQTKPAIPEVRGRFQAYLDANDRWGSLHGVLGQGEFTGAYVEGCIKFAEGAGDQEGAALGRILLAMSKTQRRKIAFTLRPTSWGPIGGS